MTELTIATIVVMIYGVLNAGGYGRALAIGGATPVGAALELSPTFVIPTFYATAMGTVVALALGLLGRGKGRAPVRRHLPPGTSLLVLFLFWSAFVTAVAPLLFPEEHVLTPGQQAAKLVPGTFSGSNSAQLIYLAFGVCVVVYLGRCTKAGPELVGLATGLTIILSMWRYFYVLGGVPFPERVFDNSPAFAFIETAPGGAPRFRGILSEPAGLAVSCVVAISYMLPRAFQVHGWRRVGALVVAGAAAYMGVISTSVTFVIAVMVIAAIAGLTFLFGFLIRRTVVGVLAGIVACGLVVAALWLLPIITAFVQTTVDAKVSSSSYNNRSGSDSFAYDLFFNTFGFGTGLGSSRASSFLPGLLSATGLIGTLLFAAVIFTLLRRSASMHEYRPVTWALVSALVVKVVSSPDLSDTSGVLYISLGLLSHAALRAEAGDDPLAADTLEADPSPIASARSQT